MKLSVFKRRRAASTMAAASAGVVCFVRSRIGRGAIENRVEPPAETRATRGRRPSFVVLREAVNIPRLRRAEAGAADIRIQQPARAECGVAHNLRLDPQPFLPREEQIARID